MLGCRLAVNKRRTWTPPKPSANLIDGERDDAELRDEQGQSYDLTPVQASGLLSVSVAPIEPTRSRLRWRLVTRLLGMGLVRMDFFDSAMLFRIEDTISSSAGSVANPAARFRSVTVAADAGFTPPRAPSAQ